MWSAQRAAAATALLVTTLPTAAAGERFDDVVAFGTGPGNEAVSGMTRDVEGNSYVVGYTSGSFPGFDNEGAVDGYLAKLGPSGELVWADQFGGTDDNGENAFSDVAIDAAGYVYVAGVTQQDLHAVTQGYSDAVVRKYSPDGTVIWGDQFHGMSDGTGFDGAFGIAVSTGGVHVAGHVDGRGILRTYTTAGALTSSTEEADVELWDVAAVGDDVYVVGARRLLDGGHGFVRRIAPAGTTEAPFAASGEPMHLAVNATSIAASGTSVPVQDTVISVWDRELRPRWTSTGNVGPDCECGQPVWGLALTDAGEVFAVGAADQPDGFVRKHAAETGERVWEVHLEAAGRGVGGVVVEGDRVVFAAASTSAVVDGEPGAFVASWPTTRTVPLTRLAGRDRVGTALAISREAFPGGARGAVLVGSRSFPDAVVAAPLAAAMGGPVLLVESQLRTAVGDELDRLLSTGAPVTIVGGSAAVPEGVARAVRARGFEVTRVSGDTRFHTAVAVARRLGSPPAMIADGMRFPDALVAASAAVRERKAVVLTAGTSLPRVTFDYLLMVAGGHVAIGGPAAAAAPGAQTIVGTDRYDTADRVATTFFGDPHVIGVASGSDFADAATLVPLLAEHAAPVLLAPPGELAPGSTDRLGLHLLEVYLAGGTIAIGTTVEQQVSALLTEGGGFELRSSPEFVNFVIPGRRPLALVTSSGESGVAIDLAATISLAGASVQITPASIEPGEVAEIWVDVPQVTKEVPLSVTVTGLQGGVARSVTIGATAVPGTDTVAGTALDIAEVFLSQLGDRVLGVPEDRTGLTGGTPVAGLLVVTHYAWFAPEVEIGLAWHVMLAPDDWAELYVRPRTSLVPTQAFRLSSWSTALAGGAHTITEIPPPATVTR